MGLKKWFATIGNEKQSEAQKIMGLLGLDNVRESVLIVSGVIIAPILFIVTLWASLSLLGYYDGHFALNSSVVMVTMAVSILVSGLGLTTMFYSINRSKTRWNQVLQIVKEVNKLDEERFKFLESTYQRLFKK